MMLKRRAPTFALRLLTSLVGFLFVCSIIVAQLPHCQCGLHCLHVELANAPAAPASAPEPETGCCPSGKQEEAPAPQPTSNLPCEEEDAPCDCPVQVSEDSGTSQATITCAVALTTVKHVASYPIPTPTAVGLLVSSVHIPGWLTIRGSPPTPAPIHVLHSVFII
jgi:hypothetical protein